MAKKTLGTQAGSVFRKPVLHQPVAPDVVRAAPDYIKTTLILRPDQRTRLDQLGVAIRASTRATVSTAAIIRGLLDAVDEAKIDLTQCRTEADVKAIVLAQLVSSPRRTTRSSQRS